MRINPIAHNSKKILNNNTRQANLIKPLEYDSAHFSGKINKKDVASSLVFLKLGQKRAQKLEFQAKEILTDAQEAIGFSYLGGYLKHTRQIITDGYEITPEKRTIAQTYTFEEGSLIKAELGFSEDSTTGEKP